MDSGTQILRELWLIVVVPTAAAIAAVVVFAKTLYDNRKLKLEIARLEHEAKLRERRIIMPSDADMKRYSKPASESAEAALHERRTAILSRAAHRVRIIVALFVIATLYAGIVVNQETDARAQVEVLQEELRSEAERLKRLNALLSTASSSGDYSTTVRLREEISDTQRNIQFLKHRLRAFERRNPYNPLRKPLPAEIAGNKG